MSIGAAIVILAGWVFASTCAASPTINEKGYGDSKKVAWLLTAIALTYECVNRFFPA